MRDCLPVPTVLTLRVAFVGDAASLMQSEDEEMRSLLLHRLMVLEAALHRVEELRPSAN